jgi:hypothetical protein
LLRALPDEIEEKPKKKKKPKKADISIQNTDSKRLKREVKEKVFHKNNFFLEYLLSQSKMLQFTAMIILKIRIFLNLHSI